MTAFLRLVASAGNPRFVRTAVSGPAGSCMLYRLDIPCAPCFGHHKGISGLNVRELCLGALTFGDASGYDLKKFFESTFSQFCAAGFGSIYPALAELAAEGLVRCTGGGRSGRSERKLYHLTESGRQAFVDSLLQASPTHRVKSDFLLVMYFGHLLPADHLQAFLDKRIAELERQIEFLKTYHPAVASTTANSKLVRDYGLTMVSAACDYLRQHHHDIINTASASRSGQQHHAGTGLHAGARQA